jgi:hypothetical protein
MKMIFGSIRGRHFGPRPLIEDASVNSDATTLWDGEVGYRFSNRARLLLELINPPALPRTACFGRTLSF